MLIGIDASRANLAEKTGVEWYGYHVIRELLKLDSQNQYRLYSWEPLKGDLADLPPNAENTVVPNQRFWAMRRFSSELRRNPVDRLFVPSHLVPRVHPFTVVTIHDLGFRQFRANYSLYHYLNLQLGTKLSARWADRVVVPSHAVEDDVRRTYNLNPSKVTVVPNGYDSKMFDGLTPGKVAGVMKHHGLDDPYLLFLGRLEVRKNLSRLLEAFYRLTDSGVFGGQLVLVGNPGTGYEAIRDLIGKQRRPSQVIHTGYVSAEERAALLRGARVFAFPSLFEGFGMPILEAFGAGTPVLTSRNGATAEVAGEAALLVDPESVDEIHRGLEQLLADQQLADELAAKGTERVKQFGWDKTARQIHQLLTA